MKRYFEKISFEQFKKDVTMDENLYNEYNLPKRNTKYSAGYDFYLLNDIVIKPNETIKIPTGLKVYMQDDEFLMLVVRSSVGCKHNVRLMNQVGIVDSDYYNNQNNEGHMFIFLQNQGQEDFILKKGEKIVQGIFVKYLTVSNDNATEIRNGGFGSTNKEEIK